MRLEVARILTRAPAQLSQTKRGGIALMASQDDIMRLNLHSRLCQRVLIRMVQAPYRTEQDIYEAAKAVPWELWFSPARTFKVEITAQHSPLKSLNFAALRVKDAVCDRFRDASQQRPSVDTHHPNMRVYAHLTADEVILYLDTSGEPLFKRGWREQVGDAPLKETLAAAMLAAIEWEKHCLQGIPLYDPCCGSGTIVIEAAQIACQIAPGLNRFFAFEQFDGFDPAPWEQLRQQALAQIRPSPTAIFASDISHRMVDFARRNAARAGPNEMIVEAIQFRGGDVLERMPPISLKPWQLGLMIVNPPYGERIEAGGFAKSLPVGEQDFFALLASHWKRHFSGWRSWVLTPDLKLPTRMRLQESRRVPLWNGPIECRLFRFDMVAGPARH